MDLIGQIDHDEPDRYTGFDFRRFYKNLAFELAALESCLPALECRHLKRTCLGALYACRSEGRTDCLADLNKECLPVLDRDCPPAPECSPGGPWGTRCLCPTGVF
jgi:hypothetical protein